MGFAKRSAHLAICCLTGCLICPSGKSLNSCPALPAKIFRFTLTPNQFYIHRRPGPQRGVSRSSQTLGRDAVDAAARLTSDAASGRRSRVVLTPRRWCQVGGGNSADDGGKKARSPGRARRKPLKPLRGECRAFSGVTVVANARVYYTPRAAAGASGARHSLRPLIGG